MFFWLVKTCGQQEKVVPNPKVLLIIFCKYNFFLEVCWIKPFLSGLNQIPFLWARTAETGPGLYKKTNVTVNSVQWIVYYVKCTDFSAQNRLKNVENPVRGVHCVEFFFYKYSLKLVLHNSHFPSALAFQADTFLILRPMFWSIFVEQLWTAINPKPLELLT